MKRVWIIGVCTAGLMFGTGMALFLTPSEGMLEKTVAESVHREEGDTIKEDTRLMVRYSFGGCGHYELKEELLPSHWIGKSADSLSLPGTVYEDYMNNTLYLAKISQKKCGRHFIVTATDGQLVVSYQNDPTKIRDRYDFSPALLPSDELERLKKGVPVESEEELTRLLEDYCS